MRLGLTALGVAIAALLAGCTTAVAGTAHMGDLSSSNARPTPTTTLETPSAPPTVLTDPSGSATETFGYWSTSDAQQEYVTLADQHNSDIAALDQALCACTGPVEILQVTDACDELASYDAVAAVALVEDPWPSDVVPAAQALAAAAKIEAAGYNDCANASTAVAVNSALEQTKPATVQAAAMRAALGLPPAPTQSAPSLITIPSATPSVGAAALGSILESVALKSTDLAGGYTVTLAPQGDQVKDEVTLDNCGYDFTTEADRVARRQYAVLTTDGEGTGVSNELVAYDSAADASSAMTQWVQSVLTCPTTPVRSKVAGVPDLTMDVILNEYQNATPLPNRVNDLTVESATGQGQTEYIIAVQQIHGRYLDSVYEELTTMPDNATIAAAERLATITGARLAAQN